MKACTLFLFLTVLFGSCSSSDTNAVIDINNTQLLTNNEIELNELLNRMPSYSTIRNNRTSSIISLYKWHENERAIKQTMALRLKIAPHDSDYTFILTRQENLFSESDIDKELVIAISEDNGQKIKMWPYTNK